MNHRTNENKPLENGSSIRLIQLPFYSNSLQEAIKKAIEHDKKTFLSKNGIEVRKIKINEIILLMEHEDTKEFCVESEEKPKLKYVYVLNSRRDAVMKLSPLLYEKYYQKHI